ncbi:MAG TPA: penicillin-binding protein 2 [Candidatus Limnocylindrales bacterium]|nr:penicillin-binding protein 2 [Candidatus Limnocylindrales bacterium]
MLGRTDSRLRLLVLLVVFVVASLALVSRLAFWQVVERDWLLERALAQTTVRIETPSRRGSIYDRSGTVALATTVDRDRLAAAPRDMTPDERRKTADELIRMLRLDEAGAATLRTNLASDKAYVIIAHGVAPSTSERIREALAAGRIADVSLEPEPVRVYPQEGGGPESTLAAHLLGFVNREGIGQYGVEQFYQDTLAGTPRVAIAQRDITGRVLSDTAHVDQDGLPGTDLNLTIDAGLQITLEQELLAAWIADQAKNVSAVVLDPYTGEIYAMATYPSYDANDYRAIASSDPSRFIDPIVSSVYEPGSVLKMFTAAAALEKGTVTPGTRIKDVGTLRLDKGRTKIDNANRQGMGWLTFEDAIAWSRNVVAAKVALGLGKTTKKAAATLHEMWVRLGFGQPTGIDVAGEVSAEAYVRDPAITPWRQIDLANGSFGQGVAVTPIQLATGYAAMVNGGKLIQPHVVRSIGNRDIPISTGTPVLSGKLSKQLTRLMDHVVTEVPFYRDRTLIQGYHVGGKTGTAQIWDPKANKGRGGWKHNKFNYSFVGYVAREKGRPDLIVAIRIEEGRPTTLRVGQIEMPVMSFALFRRIAHAAITTPDLLTLRDANLQVTPAPTAQ